jgi:signal transduction histidine kinase
MTRRQLVAYVTLLSGSLLISLAAGWTTLAVQFDNDVYDFLFRLSPDPTTPPNSLILGIDEPTLLNRGGIRSIRRIVAEAIEALATLHPRVVALDLILAEPGDPSDDLRLQSALRLSPPLILATDLLHSGAWEQPLPQFALHAAAIGHVHADPDPYDNVLRRIPLEKIGARHRFFALSLETLRVARGAVITETPSSLELAGLRIHAPRHDSRSLLIRYRRAMPHLSIHQLVTNPAAAAPLVRDKAVFIGITAQSAAQDRHMTPYSFGQTMVGVEIHANAFETLAHATFLRPAPDSAVVLFCLAVALAAGLIFYYLAGWPAYALAALLLLAVHLAPWLAFQYRIVFPYAQPFSTAWLTVVAAGVFQYFFVRRLLGRTAAEKERYQKAIHFVAHEMRTPLQAIQGSSELMGRYKLPDEKRAELARTINLESKRLARMIQTFLDVERLSEGQMELKRELFPIAPTIDACLERVRPLAERKSITLLCGPLAPATIRGDRELMEYAVYNLLTNAVKYSPASTTVTVLCPVDGHHLRLSVRDQGIGIDEKDLPKIFSKFFRTRAAEASGEAGTGIGLSLVQQIVLHHGGTMEVTSRPGQGSCFTMVLPVEGM